MENKVHHISILFFRMWIYWHVKCNPFRHFVFNSFRSHSKRVKICVWLATSFKTNEWLIPGWESEIWSQFFTLCINLHKCFNFFFHFVSLYCRHARAQKNTSKIYRQCCEFENFFGNISNNFFQDVCSVMSLRSLLSVLVWIANYLEPKDVIFFFITAWIYT